MLPRTPDKSSAAQASSSPSPGARPKTPVWREVHDKVLSERGLVERPAPMEPVAQVSPVDAVFGMLDKNHDGVISRAEWNQALQGAPVSYGVGTRSASSSSQTLATTSGVAGGGARVALHAEKQALAADDGFHGSAVSSRSPERFAGRSAPARTQATMQDLRKGIAAQRQEQEMQVAFVQDAVREVEHTRSSISGLAAERDRLQRQVQEMRGQVADTRSELANQHEQHRLQTAELRSTMADLQDEATRLQIEQKRQAKYLNEVQPRKGASSAVDSNIVRQVDGMKDVVVSQEQKLHRIEETLSESTATQRGQMAEALKQGRQLSKALEDEAQRRSQSVAQLQELIMQERGSQNGISAKISMELSKASQAMQAQTGDWLELARVIKTEVGTLAGELRTDRETRAVEASNQRYEISRMLEETRLANVASTVGHYGGGGGSLTNDLEGDLGTDMMSRAGAVAVRKMVDTTKALLHGLEEALILRAGFIAGVFHTWRCEVTLLKVARRYQEEFARHQDDWNNHLEAHRRSFEDELRRAAEHHLTHKDIVKQRTALLIDKWAYGEKVGLVRETLRVWRDFATKEKSLKRTGESIHKACYEWIEGKTKALKHTCFLDWKNLTSSEAAERRAHGLIEDRERAHKEEMARVLAESEAKIAAGMAQLECFHKQAKQDLEMVIAKWQKGSAKGLLTCTCQAWKQYVKAMKMAKKQSAAAQQAIVSFLGGQRKGLLKNVWSAWTTAVFHSRAIEAEQRRFESMLDNSRAEMEDAKKAAEDVVRSKLEAAHNAVAMTLRKWEMGDRAGALKEVFQVWSTWSTEKARLDRRRTAVHMQLEKWIEGEKRGRLHCVWLNWKASAAEAAKEQKAQAAQAKEQAALQSFLTDERKKHQTELEQYRSEAQRRKEEGHAAVQYALARWDQGEKKGLLTSVYNNWRETIKEIKQHARQRNAVHAAMLRSLAGAARAAVQLSFANWMQLAKEQSVQRTEEAKLAKEKAHWEEREKSLMMQTNQALQGAEGREAELRAKAHAATEMTLKRWIGGDRAGSLSAVFADWRRLKDFNKESRRKKKSVQDSITRFIAGERKGIMSSAFKSWANLVIMEASHKETIDKLEKRVEKLLQKHEMNMTKYARILGSADGPVLKGMVLNSWREVAQGVRYLETEREREVALEEMKRQHDIEVTRKKELQARAAVGMGAKAGKVLCVEVFSAWKLQWERAAQEQAHRLNQNKAMKEFATKQIMKQFKKDASALLGSTFAEWRREGKILRHEEAHIDAQRRLDEHGLYTEQLSNRVAGLEEQLWAAYKQIDHITETLQKELQTKAELTEELREAYEKMRHSAFTPTTQVPMSSRPSSAQSRGHSASRAEGFRRPSGGQGPAEAVFNMMDRNHDGVITRSEWNRAMHGDAAALLSPPTNTTAFGSQRPVAPIGVGSVMGGGGPRSPGRCDWDEVVKKLKAERLLGHNAAGVQEPSSASGGL